MTKVYADKELGFEKGAFARPVRRLSVELDCGLYEDPTAEVDSLSTEFQERLDSEEIY